MPTGPPKRHMMETHAITTQDLVVLGSIIGGIIGAFQALIALGDRLWKRSPEKDNTVQSLQCGFQHKEIQGLLISQTEALKEMVKALRDSVEDTKLRHQIIVDKLERIQDFVRQH